MFFRENPDITATKDLERKKVMLTKGQDTFNSVANPSDDDIYMRRELERSDLLKWQQDLNDELVKLRHKLRNEELDSDGKWVPKKILVKYEDDEEGNRYGVYALMKPLINDLGIQMIETECEPFLSRNLINSNLDDDFIRNMLKDTSNTMVDDIADHYDLYEVDELDFDHILQLVKNVIKPSPFRALNGWTKKMDNSMNKRIDAYTHTEDSSQKKGGFFGILSRGG